MFDSSQAHFFSSVDIKSSNEISLMDTEPNENLSISVQPMMYRASNFLNITKQLSEVENPVEEDTQSDDLVKEIKKSCNFRFLKKNTFIFQVTSKEILKSPNLKI